MEYEPVIGIEIHVELKTKSKMFSPAPCTFGEAPNTQTVPFDLAMPGTMPVVNEEAVVYGIKICSAMHMNIARTLYFDRKNYFYPDLPKGFQITQQFHPIGTKGYVELVIDGKTVRVGVDNAHLEEDTAKQVHLSDISLLNFNRCGTPLLEIVSEPDMHTGEEAMKYVETIREIVTYLGCSDGKMENGSMRCDINISLRPKGTTTLGTKTECKNLNTIANIRSAVDYEIKRQTEILENGGQVEQETRRWDEAKKCTVLMRKKTNAIDYKYFREPNIVPIDLDEGFIYDAQHSMNKLPNQYRAELKQLGLSDYQIEELLKDREFVTTFEDCIKLGVKSPETLWNFLMVEILGYLNKKEETLNDLKFSKDYLVSLVNAVSTGKINSKQAKEVLAVMFEDGSDPVKIIKDKGLEQISDTSAIESLVEEVLNANAQSIADWQRGKDHALGYLVGQVMKASHGKANPSLAKELILKKIGPCGSKK
ncbi:Asp-tRNA(Asn)/Glu-tRNA(Gln) amidotransferase subunit GatB [Treponema rectale]|uniref:Aspartyl/glutamyl-tRNA(Asn/Gln) amidotransferase subunit B n=1 Tax=Treponema rectale TaxID=744512 RepID=A0A7M1XIN9_9SPIR|nr:Asp-tRNA(Asn)/Glu-tRNA(Gln) amidotransferase subunit GatB [Treponema rectale]